MKTNNIVTIYQDSTNCLSKKAKAIPLTSEGFKEAREIAERLRQTFISLMPAAGLAAPQIGISKQVFLYSFDCSESNIETVINPHFEVIDAATTRSFEGCFSSIQEAGISEVANVERYNKILVTYISLECKTVKKILEGYTARIFQHEYDHIQGIMAVRKPGTEVKSFDSKSDLLAFLKHFKETNGITIEYIAPKDIGYQGYDIL